MIGIDVARIKRWFVKNKPEYSGPGYKVVVTEISQTDIDEDHNLDGEDFTFECVSYDLSDLTSPAITVTGVYNRMHYGGWNAHETTNSPT